MTNMKFAMAFSSNDLPTMVSNNSGLFVVYRTKQDKTDEYMVANYEESENQYDIWVNDDDTYSCGIAKMIRSSDHDPDGEI